MPKITLVMASGPGFPEGSEAHRYEVQLALDAQGQPDAAAWHADPAPWRARRIWPGEPETEGDVLYDPDTGWALRFFRGGADAPDAPLHHLRHIPGPMRPGEVLTIEEPDGRGYAFRIVGVG